MGVAVTTMSGCAHQLEGEGVSRHKRTGAGALWPHSSPEHSEVQTQYHDAPEQHLKQRGKHAGTSQKGWEGVDKRGTNKQEERKRNTSEARWTYSQIEVAQT